MNWLRDWMLPGQNSAYTRDYDFMYMSLVGLSAFFFLLIAVLVFFLIIRYRRRPKAHIRDIQVVIRDEGHGGGQEQPRDNDLKLAMRTHAHNPAGPWSRERIAGRVFQRIQAPFMVKGHTQHGGKPFGHYADMAGAADFQDL